MKNDVPATLAEFQARFCDETKCAEYLERWRWPSGFVCPQCGGRDAWRLTRRRLLQCRSCRHQSSITAGTVMHRSKQPLTTWFWAIFLVARHKKGISAVQLQSDLGIRRYETAWLLLHKVRRAFDESPEFPLKGVVEVDETLVGAKGKWDPPGKDPGRKAIVVAAVEIRQDKRLGALRLRKVPDYTSPSLAGFVRDNVAKEARLDTDAWAAYDVLEREGYRRREHVSSSQPSGRRHKIAMRGVHTVFGNLKTWLRGCFHGVSRRYLPAYLAEFAYRFNRRWSTADLFGWVTRRLVTRPPTTLGALQAAYATG